MKFKKHIKLNEKKNTTYQNWWDTSKVVLRGDYIALNAYIRKDEFLPQETRKIRVNRPKERRKEIMKTRAEISEIEKQGKKNTENEIKISS